jgi:hypothetical protein
LDRIELKFKVPDPQRPGFSIYVNPDLLFVADLRNLSLITELKSGRFQNFDQLDRFVRVTPMELIRYGGVPMCDHTQALSHRISVTEIINEEFVSEYLVEFVRVEHSASLITFGVSEIRSRHGALADAKLDRTVKNGVSLKNSHRPTKLIPVLPTSSDEYALLSSVINALNQLWVNNARVVTTIDVGNTVFKRLWDRFGRDTQARYLSVVKEVLNDMVETEFYSYIRPVPNERDKWALLRLPDAVDDRQRTRVYQQFNTVAQEYKWRRKNGRAYDRRRLAQFSLEDLAGYTPGSA